MPNSTRYQLGPEIGHGAMGKIFVGTDLETGQTVALKFLRPSAGDEDPAIVKRFEREGHALRQLNHPNIVAILDVADIDGQHCIVMELVEGGSLADLIESSAPLPIERVISIGIELADALSRAHFLNIVHRDIKPDNVLLTDDGSPRLTDFGLAYMKDASSLTASNVLVGTPSYLCPEAINGAKRDALGDIWALGVMLFEMLSGVRPFRGGNLFGLFNAILTQAPEPDLEVMRPDIPLALVDVIYRMLDKDRHSRIPSMRLVAAELDALRQGYSILSPMTPEPIPEPNFEGKTSIIRRPKHNLPAQTIPFVGRQAELAQIERFLSDPAIRLVTIVGAGGMGKTRLALEVGQHCIDHYGDGVFFVGLAAVNDPQNMITAIADGVGFRFYEGVEPRQQLLNFFRHKNMLLIWDNFEHLLEGAALVSDLLQIAPNVRVLVTSREKLKLSGEQVFLLGGMDVPSGEQGVDYDAAQLFIQRAKRIEPHFYVERDQYGLVRQICQLVGGMPLGLVLAAGWADQMTLREIAAELATNLTLLETDTRDIPARHRNMEAVFDHSWALLTDEERECFPKLAVFQAGFTRDAAIGVAGTTLRTLTGLVNKSLVQRDRETGRYSLHELMRQFGVELLAADSPLEQSILDGHADYYLTVLAEWHPLIRGENAPRILDDIEPELENAKKAFLHAVERGGHPTFLDAMYTLEGYFGYRGKAQELGAIWRLLVDQWRGAEDMVYGTLLALAAARTVESASADERNVYYRESLDILAGYEDDAGAGYAWQQLAWTAFIVDVESSKGHNAVALKIFRNGGQRWGIIRCHDLFAQAAQRTGNFDEALNHCNTTLRLAEETGNPFEIATSHIRHGWFNKHIGRWDDATTHLEASLRLATSLNDRFRIYLSKIYLAEVLDGQGRLNDSIQLSKEALAICQVDGDRLGIAHCQNTLGLTLIKLGDYGTARQHLEASLASHLEIRSNPWAHYAVVDSIAELDLAEGNLEAARVGFNDALKGTWETGNMGGTLFEVSQFARYEAKLGNVKRVLELLGLVLNHPASGAGVHSNGEPLVNELRAELPPEIVEAALERGKSRQLDEVVQELLVQHKR